MDNTKGLPMDLIRCALAEAAMLENERLASKCPDTVITEKIREIDYKNARKRATVCGRIPLKKKVMYALMAALIAIALAMSVSAIREPVIKFFVDVYDSFISIFVDVPEPRNVTIEEKYELGYLPEGFELVQEKVWPTSCDRVYSDGSEKIRFNQKIYSSETFSEYILDNKSSDIYTIQTTPVEIYCVTKNDKTMLLWTDKIYTFIVIFESSLTIEEYAKIVENVRLVE